MRLPPTLARMVSIAVDELADLPADEADERLAELLVAATLAVRERHPELPPGAAREMAREFVGRIVEAAVPLTSATGPDS